MKLIKKSLNICAAAALAAAMAIPASAKDVKYVFMFIGDGMGIPEVQNAQLFNKRVLKSQYPLLMTTFPVVSMITTQSANSDVTDSAAAGTALATGHKANNGMLGMNADTVAVNSVARTLADNGYGIGLITSVAIDDATPAAFYTHVPNRSMFYEIGRTLAESGVQFAAGAGLRGTKDKNGNDNGLLDYFKQNNVSIAYGLDQLDKNAEKVLVLSPFHEGTSNEIGYTVDSIPGALTLPALTRAGLEHMKKVSPKKFFMMVEGGNIDHAGHANDGGTSNREIVNFNEALAIAYDFYKDHADETLIIVTADHETGGMSAGCAATGYSVQPWNVAGQKVSKEAFNDYCKSVLKSRMNYTWDDMEQYIRDNIGLWSVVKMNPDETESLKKLFNETFEKRAAGQDIQTLYGSFGAFANRVFEILNYKAGYGWTTSSHTGSPVPLYVLGAGSDTFRYFNDNTDIPKKILKLTGVKPAKSKKK